MPCHRTSWSLSLVVPVCAVGQTGVFCWGCMVQVSQTGTQGLCRSVTCMIEVEFCTGCDIALVASVMTLELG